MASKAPRRFNFPPVSVAASHKANNSSFIYFPQPTQRLRNKPLARNSTPVNRRRGPSRPTPGQGHFWTRKNGPGPKNAPRSACARRFGGTVLLIVYCRCRPDNGYPSRTGRASLTWAKHRPRHRPTLISIVGAVPTSDILVGRDGPLSAAAAKPGPARLNCLSALSTRIKSNSSSGPTPVLRASHNGPHHCRQNVVLDSPYGDPKATT